MAQYTTKLENVSIYGGLNGFLNLPPEIDIDYTCTAWVRWETSCESREYGVKSIDIVVHSVKVDIEYSYYKDDEDDGIEEGQTTIDSEGLEIECNVVVSERGAIYPQEVEIDLKDKIKITVN